MNRILLIGLTLLLCSCECIRPEWVEQDRPTGEHSRGLSVVSDSVIWMSGANGSYARTIDGGNTWRAGRIPGADSLDLRDVEAFNTQNAVAMVAGFPALIYTTENSGLRWDTAWLDTTEGVFLDGMDFWNENDGLAFGDPIDGKLYLLSTSDGGKSWKKLVPKSIPALLKEEGGFAASGTSLQTVGDQMAYLGTGMGESARLFKTTDRGQNWTVLEPPMSSGEGCGIFSLYFQNEQAGVLVGGCWEDSTNASGNCAFTTDGGESWTAVTKNAPRGYRSCVTGTEDGKLLLTTGRSGSEYSLDGGQTWLPMGDRGYYVAGIGKDYLWATGRSGRLAKARLEGPAEE